MRYDCRTNEIGTINVSVGVLNGCKPARQHTHNFFGLVAFEFAEVQILNKVWREKAAPTKPQVSPGSSEHDVCNSLRTLLYYCRSRKSSSCGRCGSLALLEVEKWSDRDGGSTTSISAAELKQRSVSYNSRWRQVWLEQRAFLAYESREV